MGGEAPAICTQCGTPLGAREDEIAHPDDDDPPEDPHFQVQVRDDDEERLQCRETGRLAAVATPGDDDIGSEGMSYAELFQQFHDEYPPGMGQPSGEVGGESEPTRRQDLKPGGIYDVDEEKNQMDLVEEVITNARYGLNDDHIQEVKGWAKDMDGRLPPGTLEDVLKNLSGVQKQTAQLMRQRYELKLNKWMRQQSQAEEGPPIGVSTQPLPAQSGSSSPRRNATPTPQGQQNNGNHSQQESEREKQERQRREEEESGSDNLRQYRRQRRTERRQNTLDVAAEQAAREAADEMAREFMDEFGTYFRLPAKILEAKIEKDPDWAIEKAEQLDIDIFEFLEPSEKRKSELGDDGSEAAPQVDNEIDNALSELSNDDQRGSEQPPETPKSTPPDDTDASPMSATPDDEFTPEPEQSDSDEEIEDEREAADLFE